MAQSIVYLHGVPESSDITAPTLIVWGAKYPYLDATFAHAYAQAVGGRTDVEIVEDAGHWPWYEKPLVVDQVASFLTA
jgi:pimeloyl-ACP methyl ester carboxylesterase